VINLTGSGFISFTVTLNQFSYLSYLIIYSSGGGDLSLYKEKTYAKDATHLILVILLSFHLKTMLYFE